MPSDLSQYVLCTPKDPLTTGSAVLPPVDLTGDFSNTLAPILPGSFDLTQRSLPSLFSIDFSQLPSGLVSYPLANASKDAGLSDIGRSARLCKLGTKPLELYWLCYHCYNAKGVENVLWKIDKDNSSVSKHLREAHKVLIETEDDDLLIHHTIDISTFKAAFLTLIINCNLFFVKQLIRGSTSFSSSPTPILEAFSPSITALREVG